MNAQLCISPRRAKAASASRFAKLRRLLLVIAAVAGCGCITQNVVLPEAAPVSALSGGTPIGLTQVRDVRATTDTGSAGLATFRAGPELGDYLRKGIASRLGNLNFSVFDAPDPSQTGAAAPVELKATVIQATLVSAEASTPDALLVPADCEVQFAIAVYDRSGKAVYQQHYRGTDKERLDAISLNPMKAQGQILATATDAGLDQAFQDQEFIKAIK